MTNEPHRASLAPTNGALRRRGLALLVGGLSFQAGATSLYAQPAQKGAADRKACGEAYERAQELRKEGKLKGSREQLVVCSRPVCSEAVAQQCTQWFTELDQAQPTVTLGAADADGRDVTAIKVYVDGVLIASALDGMAIPVDPGKRLFVFERMTDGGPERVEVPVLVAEGEKRRKVTAKLPAPAAAALPSAPVEAPRPPAPATAAPPPGRRIPVAAWATGGLAIVAGGAGLALHLSASSAKSDLDAAKCKPFCAKSDVEAIEQKRLFRNVAFAVSGASLAATVVLVLTVPRQTGEGPSALRPRPALSFTVTPPVAGPAAVWLNGTF